MLLACKQSQQKQALEQPPGFYLTPQVVPLNLQGGYKINPITGDSVKPLLTRKGDTIVTGKPIPLDSQVVWLDSMPPPKTIPVQGKPQVIRINTHIRKAGKPELVIPAKDLLIPPKDTNFVLTNHKGDTIPTGVPIPVQKRVVPAKQVKPVVTSPLRLKNDATHHFEYLSITNNTSLDNLLMDEQGNLWTGASSKVRKYNGSSTQFLTNTEWIEEPIARANSTDRGGNIWFITNTSIIKYNGRNFTYFFPVKKVYHNPLAKVSIGLNNDIWISSFNKGVVRFDGTSVCHYTIKQGLASNNIYSVYNDSRGNTWFGTSKGISKYDGHSFTNYELNKKSNILITAIVEDYNGNIWFGTSKGICKFDGKYFIWYTEKQGVTSKFITSLSVDQNNNLWISNRKGINKFNGVNFENFTTKEGLTSNFISSAIGDSMGNLWLGAGDKIIKYNPQSFIHYNSDHKSMAINTICEGNQGNILIGGFEGFSQITDTTITFYNRENGLPIKYSFVNALTADQHNTMWFAISGKGLVKFDGEKMTHFTTQQGLISNNITSLIGDKAGNLWITTWDGISKFDGKSFTNYSTTLSRDFVTGAALDKQRHFWASIRFGGVVKITDKSLTHYSMKEGLPSNNLQLLKADKDPKVIWLSHEDGLISFNDTLFHHYATQGPFLSMNKDQRGNYWLSNNNTVYSFIKHKTQSNNYKMLSFDESDGLKKRYGRAQLINQNQKLWLGHFKGFTTLDLNKFTVPSAKPKARLERIEIDGRFLDFHHLADSTKQRLQARYDSAARFFNYPVNLSLPYDQNQLTFHFSAIEWRAPHKIRYSYRLKGLTNKWSEPSASTVADYRILPLPYGDYTFQVCAVGQAQEWGEVFEYHFTIRPPWWYTWWAKAFYALIVLMTIGAYIRWRTAGLRKRQKLLEQALIGPLIAGYRLLEQIGEGGFGLIYKATQLNTGQTVAIKV
ncbi:MAG TPA: hypothetical protein DCS93_40505, partial [Microscillaceae bacterium]|nr:hypothetical protein [Microscillaceae bacterium]